MITHDLLRGLLNYDPETGIFRWRVSRGGAIAGSEAGSVNGKGYIQIEINGRKYQAHRLAWLYEYGYFPEHGIDHINGVRDDNRLKNLRAVSVQCNNQNACMNSRNTSGVPGVVWHKTAKKWRAQIRISGKHISLGLYKDKRDAALARYKFAQNSPDWHCDARNTTLRALEKEFGAEFAKSLEVKQ